MQLQPRRRRRVEALAQMVDTAGGETGTAAHHSMHLVALLQQQLGQVGAILAGDAGYQCDLCPIISLAASVTLDQAMGVAVEMLRGEFVKLGILERFHLMDQTDRHVHAFAGLEDKFFDNFGLRRFLDPQFAGVRRADRTIRS